MPSSDALQICEKSGAIVWERLTMSSKLSSCENNDDVYLHGSRSRAKIDKLTFFHATGAAVRKITLEIYLSRGRKASNVAGKDPVMHEKLKWKCSRCRSAKMPKLNTTCPICVKAGATSATDTTNECSSCQACHPSASGGAKNFHLKGFFIKFDVLGQHIMHRLHISYIPTKVFN